MVDAIIKPVHKKYKTVFYLKLLHPKTPELHAKFDSGFFCPKIFKKFFKMAFFP